MTLLQFQIIHKTKKNTIRRMEFINLSFTVEIGPRRARAVTVLNLRVQNADRERESENNRIGYR